MPAIRKNLLVLAASSRTHGGVANAADRFEAARHQADGQGAEDLRRGRPLRPRDRQGFPWPLDPPAVPQHATDFPECRAKQASQKPRYKTPGLPFRNEKAARSPESPMSRGFPPVAKLPRSLRRRPRHSAERKGAKSAPPSCPRRSAFPGGDARAANAGKPARTPPSARKHSIAAAPSGDGYSFASEEIVFSDGKNHWNLFICWGIFHGEGAPIRIRRKQRRPWRSAWRRKRRDGRPITPRESRRETRRPPSAGSS